MTYVYHGVPEAMRGDTLIPLNHMAAADPELYATYAKKYEGRESVAQRHIALLDCSWGDVVQLLPLHPHKLFELQKRIGVIGEIPAYTYFEIDVQALDPARTAVYFKTAPGEENAHVAWLADVDLSELQDIPPATVAYYEAARAAGDPVFNYQFVPHILYAGSIDTSHARRITLG